MNKSRSTRLVITMLVSISFGGLIGAFLVYLSLAGSDDAAPTSKHEAAVESDAPLYWVAPMDPNFRRDKPGKSPMGMDLVPVFKEDAANDSPGTVEIDPAMINNLGVKTTQVQALIPSETISTFGRVTFAADAIVHIHPRVEGWVELLTVRNEGEYIEQGAPLYSLYSPELVNAQEELLIALAQNNRALISAAKARLLALNAPTSLIDGIQKKRKVERSIMFYAPQSGYVSTLNIQEGYYVSPSKTMLAIAKMEKVWVIADVFASDLHKIERGQSAVITSEQLPHLKIDSVVDYIYPSLDSATRTLQVRFVVDNNDSLLKADMFTKVRINTQSLHFGTAQKRLVVPKQAIIRSGHSDRAVLALGEGKFKSINVTLGNVYDELIEVTEGLKEGDKIVVSAQFLLDSESSINSDFMRMEPTNSMDMHEADHHGLDIGVDIDADDKADKEGHNQ